MSSDARLRIASRKYERRILCPQSSQLERRISARFWLAADTSPEYEIANSTVALHLKSHQYKLQGCELLPCAYRIAAASSRTVTTITQ